MLRKYETKYIALKQGTKKSFIFRVKVPRSRSTELVKFIQLQFWLILRFRSGVPSYLEQPSYTVTDYQPETNPISWRRDGIRFSNSRSSKESVWSNRQEADRNEIEKRTSGTREHTVSYEDWIVRGWSKAGPAAAFPNAAKCTGRYLTYSDYQNSVYKCSSQIRKKNLHPLHLDPDLDPSITNPYQLDVR